MRPSVSGARRYCLQGEPLVHHEGLVLPAPVEALQSLIVSFPAHMGQDRQRPHGLGHVRCRARLLLDFCNAEAALAGRKKAQARLTQRALAHAFRIGAIGLRGRAFLVDLFEDDPKAAAEAVPQSFPRDVDRFGVGIFADRLRNIGLRWKSQECGPVGMFQAALVRDRANALHEAGVDARLRAACDRLRHVRDMLQRIRLCRLPAVEKVAVRSDERQHFAIAAPRRSA